ncbi:MAG: NUDIX hydrolase [Proteobacteria bacterium]|uniref:NUDIX hydrolase n=1 Tax=Brevundimonas sp. TaxID=1871086 RepID=UPI00289EB2FF|nr:NUDIX hydrolase [Brevundimonas sp.]MCA0368647.1 NUDIX hydrolase [Pseudomonadota bacterium]
MANASKRTRLSETRQVAALPWRLEDGQRRILMITSRETRRWVIPKGGRMVGKSDPEAAAQEALEEAGVKGDIKDHSIGVFRYAKGLKDGGQRLCVVSVYPLEVLIQLGAWPEAHQRERRWMTPAEAAEAVHEPDLAALIRDFDATPVEG